MIIGRQQGHVFHSLSCTKLHLNLLYCHCPDVEVEGTVRNLVPGLMTMVANKRGQILLATSIYIHRYGISHSWMGVWSWRGVENTLHSCTGGGQGSSNLSRSGYSVGQLEGFIGSSVLVYIFWCLIPIFWRSVGGAPIM